MRYTVAGLDLRIGCGIEAPFFCLVEGQIEDRPGFSL